MIAAEASGAPAWLQPRPSTGGRVFFQPRAAPFYAVILGATLFLAAAVSSGLFGYEHEPLDAAAAGLIGLALIGMAWRWLNAPVLGNIAESVALFSAIAILAPLCAVALARSHFPLADNFLASVDRHLFFGFDRNAYLATVSKWPRFMAVMRFAYNSLAIQPYVLLVLLFRTNRETRGWTFMSAWYGALLVTLAVFPFAPAVSSQKDPMHWAVILLHARSGELHSLGAEALTGIVAFPSFHAAAAILLGWGFASFRYLGPPLIVLNAVMFVSAIVGGGHYLVDLAAGALVAVASIAIANRIVQAPPSKDDGIAPAP